MSGRAALVTAALVAGVVLTGCSSSTGGHSANQSTSSTSTAPVASTPTTSAATTGSATCPTLAQAEAALGGTYGGPIQNPAGGGGVVCEYTGSSATTNAGVTIFAHQSATVFAGQVAHAPGAPAMPMISGVGDGAYGQTTGGRSIVNAYSNASRTVVAAQSSGTLSQTEALAKVALADN